MNWYWAEALEDEHARQRKQDVQRIRKPPLGGSERSWVRLEVRTQGTECADLRFRGGDLVTVAAVACAETPRWFLPSLLSSEWGTSDSPWTRAWALELGSPAATLFLKYLRQLCYFVLFVLFFPLIGVLVQTFQEADTRMRLDMQEI